MDNSTLSIKPYIPKTAWIADNATVRGDVTLGEHVSIWFGAVMRGDSASISIGENSNIQDCVVLHVSANFPCIIGPNVTVGHRAIVHGCTVDEGVVIGMGAIVLDGAHIGEGALIGAGAVVPPGKIIPPNSLVLGVPARVVGALNDAQRRVGPTAVSNYLKRKELYRSGQY